MSSLPAIAPQLRAFMAYIEKAHAIESLEPVAKLDPSERYLLEIIVKRWINNSIMTVRDAMELTQLGSPATMHRKLARLRTLGFVIAQVDEDDTRIKHLLPGEPALHYFNAMGEALAQSLIDGERVPSAR